MSPSDRRCLPGLCATALLLSLPACGEGETGPIDLEARSGELLEAGVIEGQWESSIATMLDGSSRIFHQIRMGDTVYDLDLDPSIEFPDGQFPEYHSLVRVHGGMADTKFEVDELTVVQPPPEPLIDADRRDPRRIATILTFWGSQGLPNSEGVASMFTGDKSTNIYYAENSYGIETMAGKVFGPYEIEDPGGCNTQVIASRAVAAAIDHGHDPTPFTQNMFHFPGGQGCGFAGLANIGSPDAPAKNSWYHGSFGCVVRNQELGHNYGMGHSHAYACPAVPPGMDHNLYEDCEHIEYGHPYDPMGGGCGHMNVVQKTFMRWIADCNIVTATSDGIFNLSAIELPCNGTQALRFPAYDGRYYYLEYRAGMGKFIAGSGVLVNIAPEVAGFGPTGYVLDDLGATGNGYLHEGDSFTDPGSATSFTILEENDTHAVIQLTLPGGGDGQAPECRGGGAPIDEAGAIGSLECDAVPFEGDQTPPMATITYPEDGQVFEPGADFTITAELIDDFGIIEAELYLNGEPFNVLTQEPWEWPAVNTPEGTYEFGVVARDARYWTPSNAVTIYVGTAPPSADTGSDETGAEPPMGTGTSDPGMADTGDTEGTTGDGGLDGGDGDPAGCACRSGGSGTGGGLGFGLMLLGLGLGLGRSRRRRD